VIVSKHFSALLQTLLQTLLHQGYNRAFRSSGLNVKARLAMLVSVCGWSVPSFVVLVSSTSTNSFSAFS
jgi:hypothetical protein